MPEKRVQIPDVLMLKGTSVRIWLFLFLNQPLWFTATEISQYLEIPLSTVQMALKELRTLPKIVCENKRSPYPGRKAKKYRYKEKEYAFFR